MTGPLITDDLLSAYLDGALPVDETTAVEAALEAEPALRARLQRLAGVDAALRGAYGPIADDPLPERLVAAARAGRAPVAALRSKPSPRFAGWRPAAIAASAALLGGAVLGAALSGGGAQIADGATPSRALAAALSITESGGEMTDRALRVRPIMTFRATNGSVCREFLAATKGEAARGVACREGGAWRVAVLAAEAPADGYQPASGEDGPVAAYVEAVIDGAPLLGEDETEAIR